MPRDDTDQFLAAMQPALDEGQRGSDAFRRACDGLETGQDKKVTLSALQESKECYARAGSLAESAREQITRLGDPRLQEAYRLFVRSFAEYEGAVQSQCQAIGSDQIDQFVANIPASQQAQATAQHATELLVQEAAGGAGGGGCATALAAGLVLLLRRW